MTPRKPPTEAPVPLALAPDSGPLFSAILAIAADAIITTDAALTILHFNQGAEQIFGYAAAEVIGQPLDVLLPARFRATHPALVHGFGAGQSTARRMGHRRAIYGLRKDGREFPAEASIAKVQLPGQQLVYSAVLRDVSERERAEAEQRFLAESSAALAATLDYEATLATIATLPLPALGDWCTLDVPEPDGTIRHLARAVAPARAAALAALAERSPLDHDSPWPVVDVLATGRALLVAPVDAAWLEARTLDPEQRRLLHTAGVGSLVIVPLLARERVVAALTLAFDGRGRRHDAEDLATARDFAARAALAIDSARLYATAQRATRARDEVLGVVSHDLRNPLSAISMCARALRETPPTAAADRQHLATVISDSAEWMHRLIQDLLDVAAIEAGQLSLERRAEPVDAILERVLRTFERPAVERGIALGITLGVPGDAALPPVDGDAERILQVLANLVGNALKFTEPGGEVRVGAAARGGEVVFTVRDTGPGIPAEDLGHLFELYWHARRTARSRGSGYGLAIARGIVAAHGGRLWVESEVGAGSTFSFSIPASAAGAPGGDVPPRGAADAR